MTKHIHLDTYCAICELQQIAHLLPKQGPIKDFIHQNILVAFLDENFDTAVKKASELFEARSFMDFSYFRTKFAEGVISESCLQQSLDHFLPKILHCEREFFYKALFDFQVINDEKTLHFLAKKHFISNTMIKKNLALITSLKKQMCIRDRSWPNHQFSSLTNYCEPDNCARHPNKLFYR